MKKKNCFAVAGIVLLLVAGYYMPSVIMVVADEGRNAALKSFQIEEIQLNFQNVDIEEELEIFPVMLLNNIVIEKGKTSITVRPNADLQGGTEQVEMESADEESFSVLESVKDFFEVLCPNEDIEFVDFKAEYYVMMVSSEDERVYPLWGCYGIDKEKRDYSIWMDDHSKKVMAFDVPFEVIGMTDQDFFSAVESLGVYYGYEVFGFSGDVSNVYKIKTWQDTCMFFDETGKVEKPLYIGKMGERFLFNVYPGSVSFSEKVDASSD